jgi:SNF2 family DNA or RNA helicase
LSDALSLRADVHTSDHSDRLVVVPVEPSQRYAIAGALRPSIDSLSLGADGIMIPSQHAHRLLDVTTIELKWTEPARRFAENRARARQHHARVKETVEYIKRSGAEEARRLIADLDDLKRLDGHQVVNVAAMTIADSPGLCVFDEQGAGKTVTLIFAFDLLVKRNEADLLLVLAPKSMVPEWPRDIVRFKGDLYRVAVVSGSRRGKATTLRNGSDVYVTNFETAVSMEQELTGLLRARSGRAVLAIDESFFVKNLNAKRTQVVRRLREWCNRAYVLCGTPAPNRPDDLIQQFNIADFGLTFDAIRVSEDTSDALRAIRAAVEDRGLSVRHLKRDVLPGLPDKSFERVVVPLQPQQRQLYEGALRNLIIDLRNTDDATFQRELASFLARRMALLQICSNPGMIVSGYEEDPAKLLALDLIVDDLVGQNEKLIIWSFFRHSINVMSARYARYGAVRYDGSVESIEERRDAVARFQEDDVTRVFIANPAAAGAGLTLHRARYAVYESMSNQAAHYLQSLDRIHRRGQQRAVEYLILLADGTIELDEYQKLLEKEERAQQLLGDIVEPPATRERLLGDLTASAERLGVGVQ